MHKQLKIYQTTVTHSKFIKNYTRIENKQMFVKFPTQSETWNIFFHSPLLYLTATSENTISEKASTDVLRAVFSLYSHLFQPNN